MVEKHLKKRGIAEQKVLSAMGEVPRHEFVPARLKDKAYSDRALPIDENQTISQPYIVAYMIQAIEPSDCQKVLEVGTGSGYAAAVIAEIVDEVYTIERYESLANKAEKRWANLDYSNIYCKVGDGTKGWPGPSPYDGIVVSAAAPEVPETLKEQLAIDGLLVIPVGNKKIQKITLVKRVSQNEFSTEELIGVRFVPLVGEEGWHE